LAVAKRVEGALKAAKRPRRRSRLLVRSAKAKTRGLKGGDRVAEITLSEIDVATLERAKGAARQILQQYVAAVRRATETGQEVDVTIKVAPNAQATVTAAEPDAFEQALAKARDRGAARIADILKGEDMLPAADFGQLVDLSHQTVNEKRKLGEILGLEGVKRGVRYPRWQIAEGGKLLPGLAEVHKALGGDPWRVYRFLRASQSEFGGVTALQALKAGRLQEVLAVTANMAAGHFA
jgi:hypothetical protein